MVQKKKSKQVSDVKQIGRRAAVSGINGSWSLVEKLKFTLLFIKIKLLLVK